MDKTMIINVANFIGSSICISAEDGQNVFDKVKGFFQNGRNVTISFEQVSMLIPLFLNVAIGQLYGSFNEDEISSRLQIKGLSGDDMDLLKQVVVNAKRYYANPQQYDTAWLEDGIM